jgi:hypothetical protein
MAVRWRTDEEIAAALVAQGGNMRRTAAYLGYSYAGLRSRVCSQPALMALWDQGSFWGRGMRLVSDEEIVAALDRAGHVKGAAAALGVNRGTITGRRSSAVAEALARVGCLHSLRRSSLVDRRRAQVAARIADAEERRDLVRRLKEKHRLLLDGWMVEAMEAGLTQKEIGDICGVTRQRVQQVEAVLGISRKAAE